MSLEILDWVVITLYFVLSLSIAIVVSKRAGQSTGNFFLSGRKLPWYIAGTSMVATTFAADTPLAVTELVAENGIAGNWFWWNMIMGSMLIGDVLPPGLVGLLLAAFLAAYMSTISTQLNWGCSYITNDLYRPFIRPGADEKHFVRVSRVTTVLLMVCSVLVTSKLD